MHLAGLGHICTCVAVLSLIVYVDVQTTYSFDCSASCSRTNIYGVTIIHMLSIKIFIAVNSIILKNTSKILTKL